MKKLLILPIITIGFIFAVFLGFTAPLNAAVDLGSSSAILVDAETGQILYGKSPYTLYSSGNFNQLLSIVTALKYPDSPKELLVSEKALRYNTHPPLLGLAVGDTVSLTDMLYAMYLGGYNDAACVVAENIGNTLVDTKEEGYAEKTDYEKTKAAINAYIKLMNETADELCCPTMKAVNGDSLFADTQQCCPSDMARLIKGALHNKTFEKLFTTSEYTISGDPSKVNNMTIDEKIAQQKKAKAEAIAKENGEEIETEQEDDSKAADAVEETATDENAPVPTTIDLKSFNSLFNGDILYTGIIGGLNAFNTNMERYHSAVYAENEGKKLLAIVMNGGETGVYDDLQALLNFGFYKWAPAEISESDLNALLPDNVSSLDIAFVGDNTFLLPQSYEISDLEAAVAYSENGYLNGTITLSLPKGEAYAGTVATISFYEQNEKPIWGPIIKVAAIIGVIFIVVMIVFLIYRFYRKSNIKDRAYARRIRQTAMKEKEKINKAFRNEPKAHNEPEYSRHQKYAGKTYYAGKKKDYAQGKEKSREENDREKSRKGKNNDQRGKYTYRNDHR